MINLYQKQLKDKQARVIALSSELESLLEELPKLKTVVEALDALGEQPEVEPTPVDTHSIPTQPAAMPKALPSAASDISDEDAAKLLAKAKDLRAKLKDLKN